MRQHLAEREAGLVLVQQPGKQHRHDVGGRQRQLPAGLGDLRAARRVMGDQLVDAHMQPFERQAVAGQHQHIGGNRPAQIGQRAQIAAERIRLRLHGGDADIRRNLGDHLIGREEQFVLRTVQHRLLQRMPAAGVHLESPPADIEVLAVADAMVGAGHPGGDAQIHMAALQHPLGGPARPARGGGRTAASFPRPDRPGRIAAPG